MKTSARKPVDVQFLPAWHALRSRRDFSAFSAVIRSKLDWRYPIGPNQEHLRAVMEWLCRAQDITPDGGVAAAYDVSAGSWYPSYPETTGYIIPTFLDYAAFSHNPVYRARAIRMAEWLLALQMEDGAFPGPPWIKPGQEPVVFDTGQIVHGLISAFHETHEERFLAAARRAVAWLVKVQEEDGSWRRFDMDDPHVYNTRTSWAMLRLNQVEPREQTLLSAQKNLDWVMRQQASDGWFEHATFSSGETPLTHTLAYTIEGLLECGKILADTRIINAACQAAQALRERQGKDGHLKSRYGPGWQTNHQESCLTGNAQMALIWMDLYELTMDEGYLQAALKANQYLKQLHARSSEAPGTRGGVSGSYPIYGDYGPYLYLNWAAKFFADSLLREERIIGSRKE